MLGFRRKSSAKGGAFQFRVSDVVDVPLRGRVLRLRVVDGTPALDDLAVGRDLLLRSPSGEDRRVRITAHSVTAGKPSQERLDRTGEFDVLIDEGSVAGDPIEIGWMAHGPVQ
ncbi:MAG TPA: hypothetical protein VK929_17305 [Longimicrobiales bacterium]|nr:hypothetical protein [Longimicrobiales bacterium]